MAQAKAAARAPLTGKSPIITVGRFEPGVR